MRGKYDFEDKEELYYWTEYLEPGLDALESNETNEIDYSNINISPCLLGKVLEALGYEEGDSEFHKENMYVNYYNIITGKKILLCADIETFGLSLSACEENY